MKDLAYDLARNALKIKYDDLPRDVSEITKKFMLDTFACMIAGSDAPGCSIVIDQMKDWGGKKESTIMIYGGQVPAPNAALVNSMMAHAVEFDDTHDVAALHTNVTTLPAALAAAELTRHVSGKDLITAVAVGVDTTCRLGLGVLEHTWEMTATLGIFGATIAVGKILGLDEDKLIHAMGIAYSKCAGNLQCVVDASLVKRMQPGFTASDAVISSILAQKGITGPKNIFEGKYGFFPTYERGEYDRGKVLQALGEVFEGKKSSIKPYPCCRYNHPFIDAALSIVKENNINSDNVEEVIAHATRFATLIGEPFELRNSPQADAQFSIPYTIAVAIAKRDVFIDDFFEQNVRENTKVLQLAKKIKVVVDQEPVANNRFIPCIVDIITRDNKKYSKRIDFVTGDPSTPLSVKEVAHKFRRCAEFSARSMSPQHVEEIIGSVNNLEDIPDVCKIVDMFVMHDRQSS